MGHKECTDAVLHSSINISIMLQEAAFLQAGKNAAFCQAMHVLQAWLESKSAKRICW